MGPSALECLERHLLLECGMCATSLLGVGWQELQPSGWKGAADIRSIHADEQGLSVVFVLLRNYTLQCNRLIKCIWQCLRL